MIEVALIGNPNVGKTALFNVLTGGHYHVGNWPGVTVGATVQVIRRAPLGDPVDLRVRGYHLSLRREEASLVHVEPVK